MCVHISRATESNCEGQKKKMRLSDPCPLLNNVSNNVMINLVLNYGLILGTVGGICMFGSFPLFYYKFAMTAVEFQKMVTIAFLAWSGKAFVGAVTDTYPLFGYHKRWVLVAASIVMSSMLLGVAYAESAFAAILFLLCASAAAMVNNALWEGLYAGMVAHLRADPRGVSFSWGMYMAGLGLGAVMVGVFGNDTSGTFDVRAF